MPNYYFLSLFFFFTIVSAHQQEYHVKYLKDPQNQIGHVSIFIRPLQRDLDVESIGSILSNRECFNFHRKHVLLFDIFSKTSLPNRDELIGPPQKCVVCGDEFPFADLKSHSDECNEVFDLYNEESFMEMLIPGLE